MNVTEIATREVWTCGPDDSLDVAARLMWEHDCGCIPVVGKDGRVVGMLTDRDVCMAAYTTGSPLKAVQAREAMSREVHAVAASAPAANAEATMREHAVRRLPVLEDGRLVGIVSLHDLARQAASAPRRRRRSEPTAAGVGETLATICAPRRSMGA